jgi:hypothetical protein
MKIYVTIDATLEFDTSKATIKSEFIESRTEFFSSVIESAVEEYCTINHRNLAQYLKEKAKIKYIGTNVTRKEVVAE